MDYMARRSQNHEGQKPVSCLQHDKSLHQLNEKFNNTEGMTLRNIYYINLDYSKDRKKHMDRLLKGEGHPYKRWAATSRQDATEDKYIEFTHLGLKAEEASRHDGTGATYLSHVRLLKQIAKSQEGVYMILEDDVKPHNPRWADEVMCQISELPDDWHMYKFGYINTQSAKAQTSKINGCYHKLPQVGEFSCALKWISNEYNGLQGYAVNPTGAKALLTHLYEEPAFDIDGAMMNRPKDYPDAVKTNLYVSKRNFFTHGTFPSVRQ